MCSHHRCGGEEAATKALQGRKYQYVLWHRQVYIRIRISVGVDIDIVNILCAHHMLLQREGWCWCDECAHMICTKIVDDR